MKNKRIDPRKRIKSLVGTIWNFLGTKRAWYLVIALFVVQALFLVAVTRFGTPPDETNHIRFIEYYAEHSLDPVFTGQEPTLNLGDKTREVDYLYHYVMSFVLRILPGSDQIAFYVIRVFSVLFGALTLLTLTRVFLRLKVPSRAITVSLLLASNLAMVLMMSSAVNNDTLVWLGMATGLLLLLRLWERVQVMDLLWLSTIIVYGGLVKRTLLPFSLVFGVFGLVVLLRHLKAARQDLRQWNWRMVLLGLVVLLGIGLFTERVGGNIIQYGHITVKCEEVHGEAACYNFWANIRARDIAKRAPEQVIPLPVFAVRWVNESVTNIFDIQTQGWRHEVKPPAWLSPFAIGLLAIAGTYGALYESRRFRSDPLSRRRSIVALIALFFIAVHFAYNYNEYRHLHVWGLALNGRYIIPGLLPLIGLAAFYWSELLGRHLKLKVTFALLMIVLTVLLSGLFLLLQNPQLRTG